MRRPKTMEWEKNGRNERLFEQIIDVGVSAFLTNRANIPPDRHGRGGASYDKKAVWEKKIMPPLREAAEFADAVWPDYQAMLNYVECVLKNNRHLYTQGMEQAEPAAAGTEGTKDETFTSWQQVSARCARTRTAPRSSSDLAPCPSSLLLTWLLPDSRMWQAIIDVHELVEEAVRITEENKTKKAGESAAALASTCRSTCRCVRRRLAKPREWSCSYASSDSRSRWCRRTRWPSPRTSSRRRRQNSWGDLRT